ncbi:NAD(P)-binding protein [Phenylobacterium sp.]|uniref:NAD(P)-binding protein n=1 Tax=Phenylobacterium sp. TaxID=1871053 RepID=UPI00286B581C|nr:NAD(P)-binding protein [Phenylobacterium sp.]
MSPRRVRIVGGGLTGVLAAFQAHALGCREIDLHERFDELGGVARARQAHGLELREGCIYFGPPGDPMRGLLESHGIAFEDFENRFGSVSPAPGDELTITHDFGGPALVARDLTLTPLAGESLTDRLRAYPTEMAQSLTRYCQWHLGTWLDEVHESAAIPLAINRVFPVGPDIAQIAARKRADPLHDELYAIPRQLWGRLANATAALPRGGFGSLFAQCRRELERLGVRIHDTSMVSPRQALAARAPGEALVWAANPMPLFKPLGLEAPKLIKKSFATYAFKVRYGGPLPFYVQNFTAQGAIFRIYLYESRGHAVLLAECVKEACDAELRREIHRLMSGFGGASLSLGEQVAANVGPRWIYQSVDAMKKLAGLRAGFARTMGDAFVPGAWEPYAKAEKFAQVNAGLAAALDAAESPAAVSAA